MKNVSRILLAACLVLGGCENRYTALPTLGPSSTPTAAMTMATATETRAAGSSPTPAATETVPPPATPSVTSTSTPSATLSPAPDHTPTSVPLRFEAPERVDPSGPRADASGVLPNGRIVRPAGRHAFLGTVPLNLEVAPGGQILVTNDGNGNEDFGRFLQLVDPQSMSVTRVPSTHFYGVVADRAGTRVYVANGPDDRIETFALDGNTLSPLPEESVSFPARTFPMGLALSPDGRFLYASGLLSNSFWQVDLSRRSLREANEKVGNWPYTVVVSGDGSRAWVSSWGINNNNPGGIVPVPLPPTDPNAVARSSVAEIDLSGEAPTLLRYVPIARSRRIDNRKVFGGSHPSAMALSPDGALLYVTATNLDLLSVVDTATHQTVADVDLNVFGDGLQGLYPNALAVSADGRTIYVADAGINAVQVIDADPQARTFTTRGFLPTGWYPSAVALSADERTLYVASAKGLGVGPNGAELVDINERNLGATPYYIGRMIRGMVSAVDLGSVDLAAGTEQVRAQNGMVPVAAGSELDTSVVPRDFGAGPSEKIRHVVYILKENRTYDQVLGDLEVGNGDPRLTLFGEDVTPNHHALARQFAFGDNFFHDAEVSYPGHEWVTQGNNNDWVEKIWPIEYNGFLRVPFNLESGQEGFCQAGYIFEAFLRQGVSLRSYGEPLAFNSRLAAGPTGGGTTETFRLLLQAFGSIDRLVASAGDLLSGRISKLEEAGVDVQLLREKVWPELKLDYPSDILADRTDVERAELFKEELAGFEQRGDLPQFLFIWIPNDHTFGAAPRMPDPRTAVADNDRGLGLIVEALSHSRFWPETAIFVTEDDPQDGQDHVAAHRTLGMVISPFAKRGYVSPVHHSTMSMLKTMELLLGVAPMSQYDRYATDMRDYFSAEPDLTPFTAVSMRVRPRLNPEPEDQPNRLLREAGEVSEELDLEGYDEAGPELSRVLWLVHEGERVEWQKACGAGAGGVVLLALVGAGALRQRRSVVARNRRASGLPACP